MENKMKKDNSLTIYSKFKRWICDMTWFPTLQDKQNEANIKLIEAAPEMLDYLIYQAKFEVQETDGVPDKLADIIEKATGQKIEDIINE